MQKPHGKQAFKLAEALRDVLVYSRAGSTDAEPGENDAWFHARAVLRSYARDAPDFAYDWD